MTTDNARADATTITYLGHSSLLVDMKLTSGKNARILLDPGNLTPPIDNVGHVDAVLVTHSHPDHVDPAQIQRLQASGVLTVYGPADVGEQLQGLDVATTAVEPGTFDISGVKIDVAVHPHEPLYPGVPLPENVAYTIDGRIFAPGDSLALPGMPVDVLLAPLAGPWMKLSEGIDFVRAVSPRTAIPVHDAGLAPTHRRLHCAMFTANTPAGTQLRPLNPGESWSN